MKDTPLYKAAVDVVLQWDNRISIERVANAIERLRLAIQAENRMSWTEDYYDIKDNKDGKQN